MDTKILTFLIIGVVAGGGVGYIGANSIASSRNASYEMQISYLNSKINQSDVKILELTNQYESLQQQYAAIKTSNDDTQKSYDSLQLQSQQLQQQSLQIQQEKDELQASYDTLYTKYQTLIGAPIDLSGGYVAKTYTWSYGEKVWTVDLQIPKATLDYFRNHARIEGEDYSVYVTNTGDDAYMSSVSDKLLTLSTGEGYTGVQEVNFVASFVQSMPYAYDNVTTGYQDYARYPLETLADGTGDCECKAILTAELLDHLGYKVAMISLPDHVGVGVYLPNGSGTYWIHNGVKYLYLETTEKGWLVGDIPDKYSGAAAYLYPVIPVELLSFSYTYRWLGSRYTVNVTVNNEGTATASNYNVMVGFDAGGNTIWSSTNSSSFDLGPELKKIIILSLDAPSGKYTRLIIYLVNSDGLSIDTDYSGWFNT